MLGKAVCKLSKSLTCSTAELDAPPCAARTASGRSRVGTGAQSTPPASAGSERAEDVAREAEDGVRLRTELKKINWKMNH